MFFKIVVFFIVLISACVNKQVEQKAERKNIWVDPFALPEASGAAWDNVKKAADANIGNPDLSNQDDAVNVHVMAKALVYAKTDEQKYRDQVISACMNAIGTEAGGRTLALGRELAAYVIAADLVVLPDEENEIFKSWLQVTLTENLDGMTLQSTHEKRPNNWGTHAGASRVAVAIYIDDKNEIERCAKVFKGWLGDFASYDGFDYGDLSWQFDPQNPLGVNMKGATKEGHSIDGVLPDDQRRGGGFKWPPPKENYTYEALQGALAQAVMLNRVGFDVWNWEDKALLRAFKWLHEQADYPANGDDEWEPHLVNYFYDESFPAIIPARPGKNVGWTDWTYSGQEVIPPPDTIPPPKPDTTQADTVWMTFKTTDDSLVIFLNGKKIE